MKRRRIANGWNSSAFIFRECFNVKIALGIKTFCGKEFPWTLINRGISDICKNNKQQI